MEKWTMEPLPGNRLFPTFSLETFGYKSWLFATNPNNDYVFSSFSEWRCCLPLIFSHVTIICGISVQFSSVGQSCLTLFDPMNWSTPGLPVHHQLPEFTQTHVHRVRDDIQPSHPLSSPSPPASNPSQHQSIFQWINSSHEVAKVLEFQL